MEETLARLQHQYRAYRRLVLLFIPILAAAVVFAFVNRYVTFVLLAAAVLYQVLYLRRLQKKYQNDFIQNNILCTVAQKIGADHVTEESGGALTPEVLRKAALIPFDEGKATCLLREGISGELEGFQVDLCDATMAETFRLVKKGRKRVHFNSGCWVRVKLSKDTSYDFRLMDVDAVPTLVRRAYYQEHPHYEKGTLPNRNLEELFFFYRPVNTDVVPSSKLQTQLEKLSNYTPGKVALSLQGDTLHIFIRARFLARPISMRSAPSMEALGFDPFPELSYIIRVAKAIEAWQSE